MQHQFEEEPTLLTTRARLTGAMYIPYLLFGIPLFLRSKLIVPTDAAATAAHILASTNLYRATIVTDLISYLLYIALTYLFIACCGRLIERGRQWRRCSHCRAASC